MAFVEIERFALAEGVSERDFRKLDEALQAWSHARRPGLLRRTSARRGDGRWLVVTLVATADPPRGVDHGAPARWRAAIDPATYEFERYESLD
jgi:hypothetical protein